MAKILIVDDHPVNRQFLSKLLGYVQHTVYEATDGIEALEVMRAVDPDLVITDLIMPRMDGVALTQAIRANPKTASKPVVFYTASFRATEAQARAAACGVTHVFHKPARPADILKAVGELLGSPAEPVPQTESRVLDLEHLRLAALTELGLDLTRETDPERLLEKFCQAILHITGVRTAGIVVFDPDREQVIHFVRAASEGSVVPHTAPRSVVDVLKQTVGNRSLVRLAVPGVSAEQLGAPAGEPMRALLAASIHLPGPPPLVGWFYLIDKIMGQEFGRDDERLAVTLANQVSVAYANARLHAVLLQRTEELEREIAERERAESERDRFFDQSLNLQCVAGFDGFFKRLNPAWETALGFSRSELRAEPFLSFMHPDDRAAVTAQVARLTAGENTVGFECRCLCKDGSSRWFLWNVTSAPERQEMYPSGHDITDRKRSERLLRESQDRLAAIVGSAMDAVISIDAGQRVILFNRAAEGMFGIPAARALGQPIDRFIPERFRPAHTEHVRRFGGTGETNRRMGAPGAIKGLRDNGEEFPIEASLSQVEAGGQTIFTVVLRDVTERQRLEEQLCQAQKMEAVGRLAGGVAHDFNNLLTVINGYSDVILETLRAADPIREMIEEVKNSGERAARLTRQLLAFSRKQILVPVELDVGALVGEMGKMIGRLIGEDIVLRVTTDPDLWPVKADAGQTEQVLMNLVVNARDAMPEGGNITIETRNVTLDDSYVTIHPEARAGEFVMLAVSDSGCGMDAATKARIFEPFFTTKGDKGTGLGLATTFGIVKQSGGSIEVYSEPGIGTTFKIYLPRVPKGCTTSKSQATLRLPNRGTETVLLTEDEDGVRRLTRRILQGYGYRVLEAKNGGEALMACEQHAGPIHLLVTDVVMPGMSGPRLAERLAPLRPAMRVLFLSGYTDDAIVHHGVLNPNTPFLQKPFTPEALIRKVREVLDSVNPEPSEPVAP